MKTIKLLLFAFVSVILFTNCNKKCNNIAKIKEQGNFECFADSTKNETGECCLNGETSAVVYYSNKIFMAIDKVIPGHSPVFYTDYNRNSILEEKPPYQEGPIFYAKYTQAFNPKKLNILENKKLEDARKFEDFTLTPDNKYIFLSTAFNRIDPKYNMLLAWDTKNKKAINIVSPFIDENGFTSSMKIHENISKILFNNTDKENYFKIEGLAAIPDNKLLFGVREQGKSYADFDYCIKIIQVTYTVENGIIKLNNDFKLIYNYQPEKDLNLELPIALSSIEYDKYNKRLYLLTSYEHSDTDTGVGAYLWTLPMKNLYKNLPPELVLKDDNKPLLFAHKSEGVSVIDKNTVFIINDDDRILGNADITDTETQFFRKPNQSSYYIVSF